MRHGSTSYLTGHFTMSWQFYAEVTHYILSSLVVFLLIACVREGSAIDVGSPFSLSYHQLQHLVAGKWERVVALCKGVLIQFLRH
jgi:hypothetical protein